MKTFFPFVLFLFYLSSGLAQAPKPTFIVKIGDKEHQIKEGEELTLPPSEKATVLSIKLSEHKTLETDMISFNYPSSFSFEIETDIGFKSWTLDGNDYIVTVFEIAGETQLDEFVEGLVSQFGKENCEIRKIKQSVGSKMLFGRGINVTLIGQKLTYNILDMSPSEDVSWFLVLQDSPNDDGTPSEEAEKTLKMIDNSATYH